MARCVYTSAPMRQTKADCTRMTLDLGTLVSFKDVIPDSQALMGIKAVWGRIEECVMGFGSRGDPATKRGGYYSQARRTAERAMQQPYFVTIGGGEKVPDTLNGRVLELVRATGVYGETAAFVRDEHLRARLKQWPVAVILSEVFALRGEPQLVDDLGFEDRRILANAYDSVIRNDDQVQRLWNALKDREMERRWDAMPPPGFRDPGKVIPCGSKYPTLEGKSTEGQRVWRLSLDIERDRKLRRHAKELNRAANGGVFACEACHFSDPLASMFDAHHLQPLAAGIRESRVDDLVVLCPTCHRWAHAKAEDKLSPVSMDLLAKERRQDL